MTISFMQCKPPHTNTHTQAHTQAHTHTHSGVRACMHARTHARTHTHSLQPASWKQHPFKTTSSLTFPDPGTLCCSSGLICMSSVMDKATVGQGAFHSLSMMGEFKCGEVNESASIMWGSVISMAAGHSWCGVVSDWTTEHPCSMSKGIWHIKK